MEKKKWLYALLFLVLPLTFCACSSDDDETEVDPNIAKLVGRWIGTDGGDIVEAVFNADGTYTDTCGADVTSCTFTFDVNVLEFDGDCNIARIWGPTYIITFNSSNKMTWTNEDMKFWKATWVWTKQ